MIQNPHFFQYLVSRLIYVHVRRGQRVNVTMSEWNLGDVKVAVVDIVTLK